MGKGNIFVISAPSGAGKSTLCRYIREHLPEILYSVSYTTRTPRKGEVDGEDYFFVSEDEFKLGIEKDRWAEWAFVHGNYYGTSRGYLERSVEKGCNILLEIDVQGARQIKEKIPESVLIFILPPSIEELQKRLVKRATDSQEVIKKRLDAAAFEMSQCDKFDYSVVNDSFKKACAELLNIFNINMKADKKE